MSKKEKLVGAVAAIVSAAVGVMLAVQRADAVVDLFWWLRR